MKPKVILILFTILTVNLKAQTWNAGTAGNIYYNSGNVGIGTGSSPSEKLEITSVNPSIRIGDSKDVSTFGNTFTEMSSIKFYHHYNTLIGAKMYTVKKYSGGMSWGGTDLRFAVSNVSNNSIADAMTINYLGNVGIGATGPSEKLEIQATGPAIRIGDDRDVATFGSTPTEMSSIKFYHHYNTLIGAKMYTVKKYNEGMSWGGTDLRFAVSNVSNNSIADAMTINYLGNVGIGATGPSEKLEIQSTRPGIRIGDDRDVTTFGSTPTEMSSIKFYHHYNALIGAKIYTIKKYNEGMSWGGTDLRFAVSNVANNSIADAMTINYLGNILVGKTSQINSSYKLDVNGSIRSNEVVVNTTGADFVFEKEYKLMNLDEVEKYIAKNKHLPDTEPASAMEKNGLELGKMDMKLLQKIEELTLYMIDLKNEIDKVKTENKNLKARIVDLEKD